MRRSIEDRIWCFIGPGSEDPSEGFSGPGGAADSESRGGPSEGSSGSEGDGSEGDNIGSQGFSGSDRTGTVESPGFGTVENTVGPGGEMSGKERFNDLPDSFEEFIGVSDDSRLFGTQDTTGTLDEGGSAFSTNTPFLNEAISWTAAAVLPFGGSLKALGLFGPFHPDEHIPSSYRATLDAIFDFSSGKIQDEEAMRKKYGITEEVLDDTSASSADDLTPGSEGDSAELYRETVVESKPSEEETGSIFTPTLGGHEIYIDGGYQVNYRAVDHVMRGLGETNFATGAIRELLEPPPGIGIEGGIPVYPRPVNMSEPELITLDTFPLPASEDPIIEEAPTDLPRVIAY